MLDDYTKRGMVLRTTLRLAAEKGWDGLTLLEIAEDAGVTLADIYKDFGSKTGILTAFIDEVDRAMLKQAGKPDLTAPARDRLFEVIMTRLEILTPYKGALKAIYCDLRCCAPGRSSGRLLCATLNSQEWILTAAGVPPSGPRGCVRLAGMTRLYACVMRTWLNDDSDDMARTMAVLDRELSRGERWLKRLDAVVSDLRRIACRLAPRRRRAAGAEQPGAG